ncbi:ABC transporter ATP-binding protein [Candidatus Giovannonibacteria bacterium]|nr:ABC transporter ATP-binding protein [Candidatus Giovannonibacteria bacterium]
MNGKFREIISKDQEFWFKFIDQIHKRGRLGSFGNLAIMAYGAWLVRKGYWADVGMLYPLYAWSERIIRNLWQIGHLEHQINWNMPSIKSMIRALAIPPDITDKEDAKVISPGEPLKIEFENVSYSYPSAVLPDGKRPEQEQATVKNISFDIAPGEKVALVGQSGAGKTTLMRLLLRFMDPSSGSIKVNGKDLREIRQESWMRMVGYIPQHPQIFDGTIRYNLAYGLLPEEKEAAADEELGELARRLGIEFKNRNGLDTVVGRNGVKLSGGEAQRLIVGAALAKKPILMVVDEATSNLDSITEKEIQKCFAKALAGNKSALVVAHRLSTVRNICEKFIVLRAPQESENGSLQIEAVASSFEELYKISPTFRRLADAQGVIIG